MTAARRPHAVWLWLAVAILAPAAAALAIGTWPLDWAEALAGSGMDATILWQLRLPRVLAAALAGASLGLSGAILQAMLRNPLASPDIIGFTSAAGAGAVATIVVTGGSALVVPGALAAGLAGAALVMALAWRNGFDTLRLVLVGLALGMTMNALTSFMLRYSGMVQASEIARWLAGSLNARGWDSVALLAAALALLAPAVGYLRFPLERLDLGDDLARGLGLRVDAARLALSIVAVLLAALAVSVAGPLPFVAFMAGPIARALMRSSGPCLAPAAATGAAITLAADLVARFGIQGFHLPTGVFTALIGGPYLLALVVAQTRRNRL